MTKRLLSVVLAAYVCCLLGCGGSVDSPPPPPKISMAITSGSPPAGTAGVPYDGSGFALTASGGVSPYTWKWAAQSKSSLPAGISLSSDGLISGTPTLAGDYEVMVTVMDAGSPPSQISAPYAIGIAGPLALTITSGDPPSGTAGVPYGPSRTEDLACRWSPVLGWHLVCTPCLSLSACQALPPCGVLSRHLNCRETKTVFLGFTFTAGGGVAPYTWSAVGMPADLTLDAGTGEVTGTPTRSGTYKVTITANDSQPTPAQASADYSIEVIKP